MKNHLYGLDFLKAIAALMITNSHFIPLYKDVSTSMATFGVHGNALFFFVSGYLLLAGLDRRKEQFDNWYKKKIRRLLPTIITFQVGVSIICGDVITWQKLLLASGYWFIQCILVYFILFYFTGRYVLKNNNFGGGKIIFFLSLIFTIIFAVCLPQVKGSIFHSHFHYVCHFSIMLMGGLVYMKRDEIRFVSLRRDFALTILSFVLYFLLMKIGKGRDGILYYSQLTCLIPLHTFVFYLYKTASYKWCDKLFESKGIRWLFMIPAALTLEIYIV